MKQKKRGGIELSFNWMFVLLIGGVLFFFFYNVMNSQMENSKLETQVDVQTKLSQITKNAMKNPGAFYEIKTKDYYFETGFCGEGIYMNEDRNRYIHLNTFFSPKKLESTQKKIYAWVLPWNMPFRVADFLFLTTPDVKYYFIQDGKGYVDDITDGIDFTIPEEINIQIIDSNSPSIDLSSESVGRVRIISFTSLPQILNADKYLGEVSAILIAPENDVEKLEGMGKLEFYTLDAQGKGFGTTPEVSYFLGRETVFAAIFSETKEIYECGLTRAIRQMQNSFEVTINRLNVLGGEGSVSESCKLIGLYSGGSVGNLQAIVDDKNSISEGKIKLIHTNLLSGWSSLVKMNNNLETSSCPMIY